MQRAATDERITALASDDPEFCALRWSRQKAGDQFAE